MTIASSVSFNNSRRHAAKEIIMAFNFFSKKPAQKPATTTQKPAQKSAKNIPQKGKKCPHCGGKVTNEGDFYWCSKCSSAIFADEF